MNEDKAKDLESVLRNLGFKKLEACKRAEFVLERHSNHVVPLEQLIKEALAWTQQSVQQVIEATPESEAGTSPEVATINKVAENNLRQAMAVRAPTDSSGGGLGALVTLGILTGIVLWFGIIRTIVVLLTLILFFYFLGKTVGAKESS
jgi:hypothetical protein